MDDMEKVSETWNSTVRDSRHAEEIVDGVASGRIVPGFHIPGFAKFIVLRPLLWSTGRESGIRHASQVILGALRRVLGLVIESDVLKKRHFSNLFEWTEEVLGLDRPGPVHAACLRLDGSMVDGKPVFFELNADMPQGAGLSDAFSGFLEGTPFSGEVAERYPFKPVLFRDAFLRAILDEWSSSGGTGSPGICIVTWAGEPVREKDAELDCEHFASRGFDAFTADPAELEYEGGSLAARGRRIDVVYRMVSTGETLQRPEEMKALIDAEKAGAVLMINSFRSELLAHLLQLIFTNRFKPGNFGTGKWAWHYTGANLADGGIATPTALKTLPQMPCSGLLSRNVHPSDSTSTS